VTTLRKPTASVTAAGIVTIVGSVLVLLGTLFAFVVVLLLPTSQARPAMPSSVRTMATGTVAFFSGLAIFGIFTGIGVLRLKNWARISMLVWSGITAAICGCVLAFLVIIPFPTPPHAPANIAAFTRVAVGLVYGLPLAIAIWWLILFNRKAIAAQFTAPAPDSPLDASGFPSHTTSPSKPPLPLPITVLAVFLLTSSLSLFLLFFANAPMVLFAHAFRGPAGTAVWITICLVSTAAGIGLLCRKGWSYSLTLGLQLLGFLSGIVTLASPKYPDLMHEAIASMAFSTAPYPEYSIEQLRRFSYASLAFPVLIGILLLYYRSRFLQACASSNLQS
jgi:hypothetical protein